MLAGLLFAIESATDEPSRLLATLPFAGMTLIEHQARQLIAAGAGQIVVMAQDSWPALIDAVGRIARRGVSIDIASDAADALAVLHPLSRIVMLADGLVTTDAVVRMMVGADREALIVVPSQGAPTSFERVGGSDAWAGAARLNADRFGELAQLPADYDPQSTLLRLIEAAGAARLMLPANERDPHGVERSALSLARAERRIIAATLEVRPDWYHRFLIAPLVRRAMPLLVAREVDTGAVVAAGAVLALAGTVALATGRLGLGSVTIVAAVLVASIASGLTVLRGEGDLGLGLHAGRRVVAVIAALLIGWRCTVDSGSAAAWPIAIALIVAAGLVERSGAAPRRWWGGPASCLLVIAAATAAGWPLAGLTLAALYAGAMLTAAIETLRRGLAPL